MVRTYSKQKKNIRSIRQVRHKLQLTLDEIRGNSNIIPKRIAEELREEILNNYNNDFLANKVSQDDRQDRKDFGVSIEKYGTGYSVQVTGSQVIYDEFGTGQLGDDNKHPDKGKYALDPYASGPFVSEHEDEDGHYWIFKHTKTHGNPAGMFVYNSFTNVADAEAAKITANEINKTIKKATKG